MGVHFLCFFFCNGFDSRRGDIARWFSSRVARRFFRGIRGTRVVLVGGYLNNGAHAGVRCRNLNNGLGNVNWSITARISAKECADDVFVLFHFGFCTASLPAKIFA